MAYLRRQSAYYPYGAYTSSAPTPTPGGSTSAAQLPAGYSHNVMGTQTSAQAGATATGSNSPGASIPAGSIPHPLLTPSGSAASSNAPSAFVTSRGVVLQKIPYVPNVFATTNQGSNAADPSSTSHTVITAPGGAARSGLVIARTPTQASTVDTSSTTPPVATASDDGSVSTTDSSGTTVTQAADGSVTVTAPAGVTKYALPAGLGLLGLFLLFRR